MRLLLATFLLVLASVAPAAATVPERCPGAPIRADRVMTGEVGVELQSSFVLAGFEVPEGTTGLHVRYCFDQPEAPTGAASNTLDLGLYQPPQETGKLWGADEFRGWGGSELRDVTISPRGYSSEESYARDRKAAEPGTTSRAYLPGPIPPGRWAAELGLAALISPALGNLDGKVAYRVEVELDRDPALTRDAYDPPAVDTTPVRREAGWYRGDFHVHSEHSLAASYPDTFGYAFGRGGGRPDLDFVSLTEHNTIAQARDVGRIAAHYPGRLILRGNEVTTYRGHANVAGAVGYLDYRTGAVYERRDDGSLQLRRGARPASELFASARARGGLTQINHPTIFGGLGNATGICRGCSWDYSRGETGEGELDAIEVANGVASAFGTPGAGSNPFTLTAIDFWDQKLASGRRIAAVGGSDSHRAGETSSPIDAPIGVPTTVVHAEELSEAGIVCGVKAGHTYVKVTGPGAPDLRFEALPSGGNGEPAIMGDTVRAGSAAFTARVIGGDGRTLLVVRDGQTIATVPVTGQDFAHRFTGEAPGSYRLTLLRGTTVEGVASPIYLRAGAGTIERRDCRPVTAAAKVRPRLHARAGRLPVRCRATGSGVEGCRVVATGRYRLKRSGRLATRTVGRARVPGGEGERTLRVPLTRAARVAIRGSGRRGLLVRFTFTVEGAVGAEATAVRRARLIAPRPGRP